MLCRGTFATWADLTQHHKNIHNAQKEYKCMKCGDVQITASGHYEHLLVHEETNLKHECSECHRKFKFKCYLKRHMSVHSESRPFKCPSKKCNVVCKSAQALDRHMDVHLGLEFKCPKCEKSFTQKPYLTEHLNNTHGEVKPCRYFVFGCTFSHKHRNILNPHEKVCKFRETNEHQKDIHNARKESSRHHRVIKTIGIRRPIKHMPNCMLCRETFATWADLTQHHKDIHNAQKEYKCMRCGDVQITASGYYDHLLVHEETNLKHECTECHRKFKFKCYLNRHMSVHSEDRPFKCPSKKCNVACKSAQALDRHMDVHLGLEFKCPKCEKSFTQRHYLAEHLNNTHGEVKPCRYFVYGCTFSNKHRNILNPHEKVCKFRETNE